MCRLWDVEAGTQQVTMKLKSPGMSVWWHPSDPMKLMVSEKMGRIRFYDLIAEQPIVSLEASHVTMMNADWCPSNNTLVGAVSGENWHIWDISASSQPVQSGLAHQAMASQFRWCQQGESLFSTTTSLGKEFKVHHRSHQKVPVSTSLIECGSSTWHGSTPICGIADGQSIRLFAAEL
jgi:nuclear pore complex protein Nup37